MKESRFGAWLALVIGTLYFVVPLIGTFEFSLRMPLTIWRSSQLLRPSHANRLARSCAWGPPSSQVVETGLWSWPRNIGFLQFMTRATRWRLED